jgi:hypothetical protein
MSMLRKLEKAVGLPPIESFTQITDKIPDKESLALYVKLMESLPDKETLRELNKFITNAQKLAGMAVDLKDVIQLLGVVRELHFEEINQALAKLEELVKKGETMGLTEIFASIAKE